MLVSFLKQTGDVAWPDCFKTFGLLGAESSFSTAHFAVPLPVCVAVQPGGGAPVSMSSKLTVSATAVPVAIVIAIIVTLIFFIDSLPARFRLLLGRADCLQTGAEERAFDHP